MSWDINVDPEVWEFTANFGDRSIRTFIQVLATIERNENSWRLVGDWSATLSRTVRQTPANVRRQVTYMVAKGWLTVDEWSADGSPLVLSSTNYWKFHKRPEPKPDPIRNPSAAPLTNLLTDSLTKQLEAAAKSAPASSRARESTPGQGEGVLSLKTDIGLGSKDPSALIGVELWNKLEAMWLENGRRPLSIYEREAIWQQLVHYQKAGHDPKRCAEKTLQGGWKNIHIAGEREILDDPSAPNIDDILARVKNKKNGNDKIH